MTKPVAIKPPRVLDIVKIGEAHGVILPQEVLDSLGISLDGKLDAIENADGITLRRHDPEYAKQMDIAEGVMKRRWSALRELAK